jgi:GTPase
MVARVAPLREAKNEKHHINVTKVIGHLQEHHIDDGKATPYEQAGNNAADRLAGEGAKRAYFGDGTHEINDICDARGLSSNA